MINIKEAEPQYYSPTNMVMKNGDIISAWRASNGESECYTITDTNNVLNNDDIIGWNLCTDLSTIKFKHYRLLNDNVQRALKELNLPLYQSMVERGTDKLDRDFYFIEFDNLVVGYMITTNNFTPYQENGVLKYDSIHINQLELLPAFKGNRLINIILGKFGLVKNVKNPDIRVITMVGKNDYLTLYYESIGFINGENGVLYKKI